MICEVGISEDGRPYIAIERCTSTEQTLIEFFRERLRVVYGPDGLYRIWGTAAPTTAVEEPEN